MGLLDTKRLAVLDTKYLLLYTESCPPERQIEVLTSGVCDSDLMWK